MRIVERAFIPEGKWRRGGSFHSLYREAQKFHPHKHALDTPGELELAVSGAFWKYRTGRPTVAYRQCFTQFYQYHCKVRVAVEGGRDIGGFIVLHGELRALWCDVPGKRQALVRHALSLGARKLSCFDGYLVGLYSQFGFKVVRREANWVAGGPDVVYMELEVVPHEDHEEV